MQNFGTADLLAAGVFVLSWAFYAWLVDFSRWRGGTLTAAMDRHRRGWMEAMLRRDNRMLDAQIVAGLQNGASFFASTSLLC
jgi:uncharacterized membrane protein